MAVVPLLWLLALMPALPSAPATGVAKAATAVCRSWRAPAHLPCLERTADWLAEHAPDQPTPQEESDIADVLIDLWDRDGVVTKPGLYWLATHVPERMDGRLELKNLVSTSFFWRQATGDVVDLMAPGLSNYSGVWWRAWNGPGIPAAKPSP